MVGVHVEKTKHEDVLYFCQLGNGLLTTIFLCSDCYDILSSYLSINEGDSAVYGISTKCDGFVCKWPQIF